MTSVAVVIATYGDDSWNDVACRRACPSAEREADSVDGEVIRLHEPDGDLASVRNAAALTTSADWLCFLDADDELEPGYLDAMDEARGRQTGDLLVPAVRYVETDRWALTRQHGRMPLRDSVSPAAIPQRGRWPELNECVIGTLIGRREFERQGGFRHQTCDGTFLGSLEDYDLWLRCYDVGARLVYVEAAVYRAYVNPQGRNRDQSPYDSIWTDHIARIGA